MNSEGPQPYCNPERTAKKIMNPLWQYHSFLQYTAVDLWVAYMPDAKNTWRTEVGLQQWPEPLDYLLAVASGATNDRPKT